MQKVWKWTAWILGGIVGTALLLFLILAAYLTITEYNPNPVEKVSLTGEAEALVQPDDVLRVVTWNIGYAANDRYTDFFMDGGMAVNARSEEAVRQNMADITETLQMIDADAVLLQEVDRPSKRSFGVDQADWLKGMDSRDHEAYINTYLCNYVPYPLPTIGQVDSGCMTLNRFAARETERVALPVSYSWPVRLCQLKRGLLVERLPVAGSEQELVLINLHLEAYSGGKEKQAQAQQLFRLLEEEYEKGNYCIAGGDFNHRFDNAKDYPIVYDDHYVPGTLASADLPSGFSFANDGRVPTCRLLNEPYQPDTAQYYVVDGFIVSDNLRVQSTETIDRNFANSDHNPVVLTVELQ